MRVCLSHCRMFSGFCGLHSTDARWAPSVVTTKHTLLKSPRRKRQWRWQNHPRLKFSDYKSLILWLSGRGKMALSYFSSPYYECIIRKVTRRCNLILKGRFIYGISKEKVTGIIYTYENDIWKPSFIRVLLLESS